MHIPPPTHRRDRSSVGRSRWAEAAQTWLSPGQIVAGVDGGSSGRDAGALAALLARETQADLILIAVYEVPLMEALPPDEFSSSTLEKQARTMVVGSARRCDDGRMGLGRSARERFGHLECPLAIAPADRASRGKLAVKQIGVATLADMGVPARLEVEAGSPAEALGELSQQVDLLVIGSSRRGRPGHVELGDTGRKVLEQPRSPVLVVPRP